MARGNNIDTLREKFFLNWLGVDKAILRDIPIQHNDIEVASISLSKLKQSVESCSLCRLCETRKNTVFGEGNETSPLIMFIGEGPGADEDESGRPFVGRAGELLTSAIEKGLKLNRSDVYIANVVKCRPPENRAPLPDEVESCRGYLENQIKLINPKVIVTLGAPALKTLTDTDRGITKARGNWHSWSNFKVMPTFHPAYILRNPSAKKEFWADLRLVMLELGLPT